MHHNTKINTDRNLKQQTMTNDNKHDMKTVLQQIIEKLEVNAKEICPMDIDDILIWIEENELIKEEKQQIIDAYWGGLNGCMNDYSDCKEANNETIGIKFGEGAEFYYKKTYQND